MHVDILLVSLSQTPRVYWPIIGTIRASVNAEPGLWHALGRPVSQDKQIQASSGSTHCLYQGVQHFLEYSAYSPFIFTSIRPIFCEKYKLTKVQWHVYMMAELQGTSPRRNHTGGTATDLNHVRDSTVERIIGLHEDGTTAEEIPSAYENISQQIHSSYIPVSDEAYANSTNTYFAPAQTATTSYWPEQDSTWNNQYTAPSSSSYDASYYNVSTTQARGESYVAGYYANNYSAAAAYTQQGGPWFAAASSDARTFVPNGTVYDDFGNPSIISPRRNGDGTPYSQPGTDQS